MRWNREFDDEKVNSSAFKKYYRRKECRKDRKCDRCPWHGGMDNYSRRPKDDVYKNKNRNTIRRYNEDDCYFFKG
jgi:hypothetical protein